MRLREDVAACIGRHRRVQTGRGDAVVAVFFSLAAFARRAVIDPSKPFDIERRVTDEYGGERLDRYVRAVMPSISRTRIQGYNRDGRILVNGTRRPDNWKVKVGDLVLLKRRVPEGGEHLGRDIPLDILYEDDDMLAVNKQPDLIVHPVGIHRHDTLLNALYWRYRETLPEGGEISLANRIDRWTSGLVLAAKHAEAKRAFQEQFEGRSVEKEYVALVEGEPPEAKGCIDLPIGPKAGSENRCLMDIRRDDAGKPSTTRYRLDERLGPFSVVRAAPKTGRQHQIRVHLAAVGCPLAGDHLYGTRTGLRCIGDDGTVAEIARFALHAERTTFRHPGTGAITTLSAPLADDMDAVIRALRTDARTERFELDHIAPREDVPEENGRDDYWDEEHEFDTL